MADPIRYQPNYDFSDFETTQPQTPKPGTRLDEQFDNISLSTTSLRDAIKDVRRSDGKLANGIVTPDSLAASLSIGFTMRGAWASGVTYNAADGVTYGTSFYKASVGHTSSNGTRPDLDPSTWTFLFTFSTISVADGTITPAKIATSNDAAFQAAFGTGGQLGPLIDALTGKATPADADTLALSDSASGQASKKLTIANLAQAVWSRLGALIANATAISSLADSDTFAVADSTASNASKKVLFSSVVTSVAGKLGVALASQTGKPTPVDDDLILVADSASSNASRKTKFSEFATAIVPKLSATAANFLANANSLLLPSTALWSAAQEVSLTDAATIAVDMSTFINGKVTLGGNRTLGQPSNTKVGQTGRIKITQDATGSRTLSYHADWKFAGGAAPVLSTGANKVDVLYYEVLSANTILGSLIKDVR